ncbi:hypothetical protein pETSU_217 [Edwardsiella phage pEt-SU]|uniref:Uncharacterized protein n=1 Tax=Edwardsiella phage pEt-SU TaxID=2562142 RepID=A0A4D6DX61_9CAUD|nr:hypothetical protein HOV39_gp217 [Edwardsiella phage pEt-SU]QBZ70798.1 hypothetical protein pETSU_217 [Edwardsiella phage pEt-SU]
MSLNIYGELAKFRVNTFFTMTTARKRELVYRDIDKVLLRICNSIRKGYALKDRARAGQEILRRYPYFEVTVADIYSQRELEVVITRRHKDVISSITINEDNIGQFEAWCKEWRTELKPTDFSALAQFNPNQRYW